MIRAISTWCSSIDKRGSPKLRRMQERLSRFSRDQDGSALLEGAVIVPVLLIFVLGVYEFSWFFYQQHVVSTGLRDAARYLARISTTCAAPTPGWTIAVANAERLATTGSLAGGAPRVKGWTDAMVKFDCR